MLAYATRSLLRSPIFCLAFGNDCSLQYLHMVRTLQIQKLRKHITKDFLVLEETPMV